MIKDCTVEQGGCNMDAIIVLQLQIRFCMMLTFQDWNDDFIKLMQAKQRDKEKILTSYREMYRDLLDHRNAAEDASLYETQEGTQTIPNNVGMGPYRQKFARVCRIYT